MRHKQEYKNRFFTAIVIGALSLFLTACGDGENTQQTAEADTGTTEAYTGTDYSTMVNSPDIRNGVVFGEIVIGNPDAPVSMIEYASLTCPHCAAFHNSVLPEVMEKYIKTGKVKLIYRNFTRDKYDLAVSMITRCFGVDKSLDLMGLYFERQRQWAVQDADTQIGAVARTAGITRLDLDACLSNTELQSALLEMLKAGQAEGVNGTPTFLINGEKYVGSGSLEIFSKIIDGKL